MAERGAWLAGLALALVATVLVSATVGWAAIGPLTVAKVMLDAAAVPLPTLAGGRPGLTWYSPLSFAVPETSRTIVTALRLPRIVLGAVVGFALATAGAVMQGFFRNPMADPSIIGVSSGAAAGAVAVIAFPLAVPFGLEAAAFAGALVAGFGVYLVATRDGRTPVATLLLAGVAVQTFLGAVISFMLLHAGESLDRAVYWLMGHLSNAAWGEVWVAGAVAVPSFAVLYAYSRELDVLLLGEADAHALGVEVERTKRLLLAGSSVITAAAVAVAGVIGFVGLIVPHVMRLLVGPDHRTLLPTSALAGAIFLVATDAVARSGPGGLPVGIVTAGVGAPFFLYLLRREEVYEL